MLLLARSLFGAEVHVTSYDTTTETVMIRLRFEAERLSGASVGAFTAGTETRRQRGSTDCYFVWPRR